MKAMAFLVFISCCVSAFCLGLMTYTMVTGELPFNLQSVYDRKMKAVNEDGVTEEEKEEKAKNAELEKIGW